MILVLQHIGLLGMLLAVVVLFYFWAGRSVCPPVERVPVDRMTRTDLWQTLRRGWFAVGRWMDRRRPPDWTDENR
ncbi:hypothetical protein [Brevibacterium litoralis]|uniref:hypothetical protein n=1 Tax=Brevibacterium litoralis TaxID=3138935 RepID=UPI0032EF704A